MIQDRGRAQSRRPSSAIDWFPGLVVSGRISSVCRIAPGDCCPKHPNRPQSNLFLRGVGGRDRAFRDRQSGRPRTVAESRGRRPGRVEGRRSGCGESGGRAFLGAGKCDLGLPFDPRIHGLGSDVNPRVSKCLSHLVMLCGGAGASACLVGVSLAVWGHGASKRKPVDSRLVCVI